MDTTNVGGLTGESHGQHGCCQRIYHPLGLEFSVLLKRELGDGRVIEG